MQAWNIFICRKTFEQGGVIRRTGNLIYDMFKPKEIAED